MIERSTFGVLENGASIERIDLSLGSDFSISVISLGATLQALRAPDRDGQLASVVLAYPALDDYLTASDYFGATIGRYANRIAYGRFELDGVQYQIACNEGEHALHGGRDGFDRRPWRVVQLSDKPEAPSVRLELDSPAGDQGFPGVLTMAVTYTLAAPGDVIISYEAHTDAPTIFNPTNHAYFNLAGEGEGTILDHEASILADSFLPVDEKLIPLGERRDVAGTVFDFRESKRFGRDIQSSDQQIRLGHGYDHCFVLSGTDRSSGLKLAARVVEPAHGRTLEVLTTEPGLQLYTGNMLSGRHVGPSGRAYGQSSGFCLETQHFPNAPNLADFPATVLRPGEVHRSTTIYRLGCLSR